MTASVTCLAATAHGTPTVYGARARFVPFFMSASEDEPLLNVDRRSSANLGGTVLPGAIIDREVLRMSRE